MMAHAQQTVLVNRPIGEVFAFLADGMNEPLWRPGVTNVSHVSGSGVGAQFTQTMKGPGGRSIPGDYRITRYDEPTRLDFGPRPLTRCSPVSTSDGPNAAQSVTERDDVCFRRDRQIPHGLRRVALRAL